MLAIERKNEILNKLRMEQRVQDIYPLGHGMTFTDSMLTEAVQI